MKNRTVLRARSAVGLAVVALAGSLTLAACSSDDDSTSTPTSSSSATSAAPAAATPSAADVAAVGKITVTGAAGKKPTVTLPTTPFTVTATTARRVSDGTGAALKDGQILTIRESVVSGADGKAGGDNYSGDPETVQYLSAQFPATLTAAFDGAKVGARIVVASPSTGTDGTSTTTYVSAIEVTGAKDARAAGTAVTPKAGLPTVTLASDGEPSITIPKGYTAPKSLVVQTLIKGDGPKVTATDTVLAQYSGWTLDGKSFDSSWKTGTAVSFSLAGGVIEGWTKGLTGQTVGSQVELIIPADLAYGDNPPSGSDIPKGATLIFVVDILGAQAATS
ncbi:FKBP-type peptidyl-prolyl cis-trans isomerase [Luteimicrobium subarcticum]|uniref:peptidylprolyl isomerase n=1 Tax=Luteimicrobium subarcticum TaxID=620910 RepID=A0A2M8W1I1_9MICO|nr:FKBP-type peptidyl-prolyl cis-trans isomerase [Luteimicrobium subarcticum]PJI84770.1 peptidylprolyl isomerase [Luteimicrobium subarcticum]